MPTVTRETRQLSELHPADYNPRSIDGRALAGLRESIKRWGLVEPIVWNRQTGNVVGGHQRLKVLTEEGVEEVEVIVVDISLEEEKALNVTLNNRHIQGDWTQGVSVLLEEIGNDIDMDAFNGLQLDKLLQDANSLFPPLDSPDPVPVSQPPEPNKVEPRCKKGELWQLGPHRLLCGDATLDEDVRRLMNDHKADMFFIDPPYGIEYSSHKGKADLKDNGKRKQRQRKWKNIEGDNDLEAIKKALPNINKYLHPQGSLYVCSSDKYLSTVRQLLRDEGIYAIDPNIIWVKNRPVVSWIRYHPQHESIIYGGNGAKPGRHSTWHGPKNETTVWEIDVDPNPNYLHPTQKPIALPARAIRNSSKEGQLVADFFAGSGSTLLAADQLNRTAYAMELMPEFCDAIIARYETMTGLKAKKER